MQAQVERIRAGTDLASVKMLREFEPSERVAARLEISTGSIFRGRSAGIDVMGDGSIVAFAGGVARRPLEPEASEPPYAAIARELEGQSR